MSVRLISVIFSLTLWAVLDPDLCVTSIQFSEGGRPWFLRIVENKTKPGPLWAVPHNNERAAFDTAADAVRRYGGVIVAVETGGSRYFMGQDPNRNFGEAAVRSSGRRRPAIPKRFFRAGTAAIPLSPSTTIIPAQRMGGRSGHCTTRRFSFRAELFPARGRLTTRLSSSPPRARAASLPSLRRSTIVK